MFGITPPSETRLLEILIKLISCLLSIVASFQRKIYVGETLHYPTMLRWINESYSTDLTFWTWSQVADEMLEDMHLRSRRSGGNWLTWPFKVGLDAFWNKLIGAIPFATMMDASSRGAG
ncbi:hypothetical protein BD779DRAFT_208198 [Infundibulicybe gibba]|nr:hypothetical protein BD779DRAFT_208198 [Infundibulicybe gibba]